MSGDGGAETGGLASRAAAGVSGCISTHISILVFLGDLVYKFRRPVRFGFLDLSTPQARRLDCEREVALNARLAPDVYLGVEEFRVARGEFEPVVVMRRLPTERSLASLVQRGGDISDEIRDVARAIAHFHAGADRSFEIDKFGTAAAMTRRWADNFRESRPFVGDVFDARLDLAIHELAERYIKGRDLLFAQRIASRMICDGHGDLQASDIFCLSDGPRILDCLEFDDHLRYMDAIDDLSFLLMDLDRLGAPGVASELLGDYDEFSGTVAPPSLVDHYRAYHAYVRAKVACLRVADSRGARIEAQRLHSLSLEYLRRSRVRLVLVGGLPGSGKSTLAAGLGGQTGATVIRSDEVRREFERDRIRPASSERYREGRYSPERTARTYQVLLERARIGLRYGNSMILDASWSDASFRAAAGVLATESSADLIELRCSLDPERMAERIALRNRLDGDPSEATIEVAMAMAKDADPWPGAVTVDTSGDSRSTLERARRVWERCDEAGGQRTEPVSRV